MALLEGPSSTPTLKCRGPDCVALSSLGPSRRFFFFSYLLSRTRKDSSKPLRCFVRVCCVQDGKRGVLIASPLGGWEVPSAVGLYWSFYCYRGCDCASYGDRYREGDGANEWLGVSSQRCTLSPLTAPFLGYLFVILYLRR